MWPSSNISYSLSQPFQDEMYSCILVQSKEIQSHFQQGRWESYQWLGAKQVVFAEYSGFLHYLQLASYELATIGIKVTKNKIPNVIRKMNNQHCFL